MQSLKANWYHYAQDGSNPSTPCDTGEYYYFYDALGNVVGVQQEGYYSGAPTNFYRWEMDAFGNPLSSGNDFLAMDQPGPKEHLTGKMYDTATGLYYFHARWYDPQVGRFVGRDIIPNVNMYVLCNSDPNNCFDPDGNWGYSVHYSFTVKVALEFFNGRCARMIGMADQKTDENFLTHPLVGLNYEEYHYNNAKAMRRIESGITRCNCDEFGLGLHGLQDSFTHGRFPPPEGHVHEGHWPDDENDPRNAREWILTQRATRKQIERLARCCRCGKSGGFTR